MCAAWVHSILVITGLAEGSFTALNALLGQASIFFLSHASSHVTRYTFLDQLEMRAIFFLKIQQRRSRDGSTLD